jgi:hypothetical protein
MDGAPSQITRPLKPTYPLRLFFGCSTDHLSPCAIAYLQAATTRTRSHPLSWTLATPFGWLVWVEEDPDDLIPEDLAVIMRHAHGQGAEYILFDCDAPHSDDFPLLGLPA